MQRFIVLLLLALFCLNLQAQNIWEGDVSTDWYDAGNWSYGTVPTSSDDVRIPTTPSGPNWPIIASGTAYCRGMTIQSGGQLTMSGGELRVNRNWFKSGNFYASGGKVVFEGVIKQSITGATTFYDLELANAGPATQDTVIFNDNVTVLNDITFTSGRCKPGTAGESNLVTVEGNWYSNGGYYHPNLGIVVFSGDYDKQLIGTSNNATTFYNLSIQKTSGYAAFTSTLNLTILSSVDIESGEWVVPPTGTLPTVTIQQDLRIYNGAGIMLQNTANTQNVEIQIARNFIDYNTSAASRSMATNTAYGVNFTDGSALITLNSSSVSQNQTLIGYGKVIANNTGNNLQKGLRLPSLTINTDAIAYVENEGFRTLGILTIQKGTLKANGKKIILGHTTGTNIVTNTGVLDMDGGSFLMLSTNSTTGPLLRVENGGTLRLVGSSLGNPVRINRDGGSGRYYRINIASGGNLYARYYAFYLLHQEGLIMMPGSNLAAYPENLSDGSFNETNAGATVRYIVFQQDFPSDITIQNVRFNLTNTVFNCSRPAGAAGNVNFVNCTGVRSGPGFEEDPADATPSTTEPDNDGKIRWSNTFVVRQWSGTVNNQWYNSGNWVGGIVPAATEDALIPSGCPNYPILENHVTINNLNITANVAGAILTTNGFNLTVNGDLIKTAGSAGNITVSANSTLAIRYNFLIDAAHLNALNDSRVEFFGSSSIDKVFSFAHLVINGGVFVSNGGSNSVIRQDLNLQSGNLVYVNQNCNLIVEEDWNNTGGQFTHVGGRVQFRSRTNTTKTITSNGVAFGTVLIQPNGSVGSSCTYQLLDDMTCTSEATGTGTSGNSLSLVGNSDNGTVTLDLNGKVLKVNHLYINGNTSGTNSVYHATLLASPGSTIKIGAGFSLTTANRTPRIQLLGTSSQRVTITTHGTGTYTFSANTASAGYNLLIEAIYTDFEFFDANGINCAGANVSVSTTNNFSYCSFTNFTGAAGTMLQLPNVLLNNIIETRFTFIGTPVAGTHFNVFRSGAGTGAATFVNPIGNLKGPVFEKDPTGNTNPGNIIWTDNNIYWGPFASGDWNDMPSKWRDGVGNVVPIPTATDRVILDHTHQPTAYVITNSSGATCKDLVFSSGNQSITLQNNATLSLTGSLQMTSNYDTLMASSSGHINIQGNWLTSLGNFIPSTNQIVTFSGSSSAINTTLNNAFEHVTINCPSNTITLASPIRIKRNLTLTAGTLDVGSTNNTIYIQRNWVGTSNGFFNPREGTVVFEAAANQFITNPNNQYFYNLQVNKTSNNLNLNNDIFILSTLEFRSSNRARVITGSNIVRMQEAAAVVGVNPSGTNGFVDKRMSFIFKSSTTKWFRTYTLGVSSYIDYLPVDLNLQLANNTPTEILIEQFNAAPPSRIYPTMPDNIVLNSTAHYFTVTNMTGTPITACDITLRYNYKDMLSMGNYNVGILRILKENSVDGALWDNITPGVGANGNYNYGFHTSTVNITGFSDFVFAITDGPLPVELNTFTANYLPEQNKVALQWNTSSETNNAGFIIHKSFDLNQWEKIQDFNTHPALIGHGTTTNPSSYLTFDEQNLKPNTTIYYKLFQQDLNGYQRAIGVASVFIPENLNPITFTNYPNPFNDKHCFNIQIPENQHVKLVIYDFEGRLVQTIIDSNLSQGNHTFAFEPQNLPHGVYFYQLTTPSHTSSGKLIFSPK